MGDRSSIVLGSAHPNTPECDKENAAVVPARSLSRHGDSEYADQPILRAGIALDNQDRPQNSQKVFSVQPTFQNLHHVLNKAGYLG